MASSNWLGGVPFDSLITELATSPPTGQDSPIQEFVSPPHWEDAPIRICTICDIVELVYSSDHGVSYLVDVNSTDTWTSMTTMIEVVVVEGVGQAHQKVSSQYPSIPVSEDLVSYGGNGGSSGLGCLTRARSSLTLLSSCSSISFVTA